MVSLRNLMPRPAMARPPSALAAAALAACFGLLAPSAARGAGPVVGWGLGNTPSIRATAIAVSDQDGAVVCWGQDSDGQATPPPSVDGTFGSATAIAAGGHHSLAIEELLAAEIDIKPGDATNRIQPFSRGVIRVAILGSDDFDVNEIDVTTLAFGRDAAPPIGKKGGRFEDVNSDGFEDLVTRYPTDETGITTGDTQACVVGELWVGTSIGGCDAIRSSSLR